MARTKRASKPTESTNAAAEEVLTRLRDDVEAESNAPAATKRLIRQPAEDGSNFLCRLFELRYNRIYSQRKIFNGKPPKFEELPIPGFKEICDYQGWTELFKYDTCYPRLVRLFYANMWLCKDLDGERSVCSWVNGRSIALTASEISNAFQIHIGGYWVKNFDQWRGIDLDKNTVYKNLFGEETEGNSRNDLSMCARAVLGTIVQFIQGRSGKDGFDLDFVYTHQVLNGEKLDIGSIFIQNLEQCFNNPKRSLAYGALLTRIFERFGVDLTGEEYETIDTFFGKRSFGAMRYRRYGKKRQLEEDVIGGETSQVGQQSIQLKLEQIKQRQRNQRRRFKKFKMDVKARLKGISAQLMDVSAKLVDVFHALNKTPPPSPGHHEQSPSGVQGAPPPSPGHEQSQPAMEGTPPPS